MATTGSTTNSIPLDKESLARMQKSLDSMRDAMLGLADAFQLAGDKLAEAIQDNPTLFETEEKDPDA